MVVGQHAHVRRDGAWQALSWRAYTELARRVARNAPGTTITVAYMRDGKKVDLPTRKRGKKKRR